MKNYLLSLIILTALQSCKKQEIGILEIYPEINKQEFYSIVGENNYSYIVGSEDNKSGDDDLLICFKKDKYTISDFRYNNYGKVFEITEEASRYVLKIRDYDLTEISKKENEKIDTLIVSIRTKDSINDIWEIKNNDHNNYLTEYSSKDKTDYIKKASLDSIMINIDPDLSQMWGYTNPIPFYFKLKAPYAHWKNYNPIRYIASKGTISLYSSPSATSKSITTLDYNDLVIINDTLKTDSEANNLWLKVSNLHKEGYLESKYLTKKPTFYN